MWSCHCPTWLGGSRAASALVFELQPNLLILFFFGTGQNPIEAASAPGWTGRLAAAALAEHSLQEGRRVGGGGAAAVLSILQI